MFYENMYVVLHMYDMIWRIGTCSINYTITMYNMAEDKLYRM